MSHTKYILTGFFIFTAVYILGCSKIYNKFDPEPPMARRATDCPASANFAAQADNAILTSMTVADVHFAPYRPELNCLGRSHLTAIASYLEQYGGEVTFDCQKAAPIVRQQRLENVRHFLEGQGLDPELLTIVTGLARGSGQDAEEAALFYEQNLVPEQTSSVGQTADPSGAAAALGAEAK